MQEGQQFSDNEHFFNIYTLSERKSKQSQKQYFNETKKDFVYVAL
jgi:hypothetical protein